MKVILAQGNPGLQYTETRHNIGWLLLDTLADGTPFQPRSKFFADIAEKTIAGEKILFVKPTTFYNETGRSARAIMDFYKLEASNIFVIHDDLMLPFGTIRVRQKGSDGGNNGIKSLNTHIGEDYWRLRVGIYNELRERHHDADFVLSRIPSEDMITLHTKIAPLVMETVKQFIHESIAATSINTITT